MSVKIEIVNHFPFYCGDKLDLYFGERDNEYDDLIPIIVTDGRRGYIFRAYEIRVGIGSMNINESFTRYEFTHLSGSTYIFKRSSTVSEDDIFTVAAIRRGHYVRDKDHFSLESSK